MRTESEIRIALATLRTALGSVCGCADTGHGRECRLGGMLLNAAISQLQWVVGESDDYEDILAELRERQQARGEGVGNG